MTRIEKIQKELAARELDGLVLYSETNVRYAARFFITDGAALVTRDGAWLLTDSRYIEAARAGARDVEVLQFTARKELDVWLKELLSGCRRVGAEEGRLAHGAWLRREKELGVELVPAEELMAQMRAVKEPEEVECLVRAQRIAEKALEQVLPLIRPGVKEREIAAELTYRMMLLGGEGNSFDPITITGANTSLPHGVPGDAAVREGDFVTMDFGTLWKGYHSDMTRTVAVGHATEEMRRVYDTVLRAQEAGIAVAKAGVTGAAVHQAGAKVIADAGYGAYFGHGFGHSVGLEIHEEPRASVKNDKPLPAGAVITAEPGIYLPGRFGVRIEDMILITGDGCENLTKAPKELIVL
ncbi:MAG: aminopeptidase P family protein [Oscillospiraceae bacterium]|nr:aminopeptidase P family protein [Oscillospiraceae bacterium]